MKQESGFGWSEENRRKKPKQRLAGGRGLGGAQLCGRAWWGEAGRVVCLRPGRGCVRSPCVMLPNQAVTPGHSNHTGSFICWHLLFTVLGQSCINPKVKRLP